MSLEMRGGAGGVADAVITREPQPQMLRLKLEFVCLLLGDPEVANLYYNFAYPYWEGCVICSIYLR